MSPGNVYSDTLICMTIWAPLWDSLQPRENDILVLNGLARESLNLRSMDLLPCCLGGLLPCCLPALLPCPPCPPCLPCLPCLPSLPCQLCLPCCIAPLLPCLGPADEGKYALPLCRHGLDALLSGCSAVLLPCFGDMSIQGLAALL